MSVALIGLGEFIGEEALVGAEQRPFSATVVEHCIVLRARGDKLGLFRAYAAHAMNAGRHMSARCEEMSDRGAPSSMRGIDARLSCLRCKRDHRRVSAHGLPSANPYLWSQESI